MSRESQSNKRPKTDYTRSKRNSHESKRTRHSGYAPLFFASCTGSKDQIPEADTHALLGEGLGISNVTVLVQNLDSARNYFTDVLGFNMPKPKDFQNGMYEGTLSVSLAFATFSSFELSGVKDTAVVAAKYPYITAYLKHHEGVRTYALSTSSVDSTSKWLHSKGLKQAPS